MPRRDDMLRRLDEPFDLLIIGGGITGCGAARDAARRGLRVVLVEMEDLAFGTSSRSSKLVHGGLRYLENAEFSLVFEAVSERRTLMNIAPHLVNPLGFIFPVYKDSRRGVFSVNVGMWLYDGLSLFRSPHIHRNLSRKEIREEEPLLRKEGLRGAPLYYDCATDDARLTLENALDAAANGAVVATHCRVVGLVRDAAGRVSGARVRDDLAGRELSVTAGAVINATGPWSDRVRALGSGGAPALRPTKGIHIVVDAERLKVKNAVVCFHPHDGRVLFAIPWSDRTYIGTTDTDFQGDPGDVAATLSDVDYLIDASNHYFPDARLVHDDVIATWAGVRPLIVDQNANGESAVSREHEIFIDPDGLITIAGGKLTTYRRMAAELVDQALNMLMVLGLVPTELADARTDREALPGAVGWPEDDDHEAVARRVEAAGEGKLGPATCRVLGDQYGMVGLDIAMRAAREPELLVAMVPGRPEIMAQVAHAVEAELAGTLCDVMVRRTQLFFRDTDQGLGACEAVAALMGRLLGWDEARVTQEVLGYQQVVARSRRWREGA